MSPVACPNHQEMVRFVLGQLPDARCDWISRHLDVCAKCQTAAARVDDHRDPLVAGLRSGRPATTDQGSCEPLAKTIPRGLRASSAHVRVVPVRSEAGSITQISPSVERWLAKHHKPRLPNWVKAYGTSTLFHVGLGVLLSVIVIPHLLSISSPISLVVSTATDDSDGPYTIEPETIAPTGMEKLVGPDTNMYEPPPQSEGVEADAFDLPNGIADEFEPPNEVPPLFDLPPSEPLPDGARGNPREIVNSYEDALHALSRDILRLLEQSSVLLIWCFDRSESMNDDRQTIRRLLTRLYREIDENRPITGYHVATVVASFGERFVDHTGKAPMTESDSVIQAVGRVGSETSGVERMVSAAREAIQKYRGFAHHQEHRMVMVVVTDESGEPDDNHTHLENLIAEARTRACRIYVFGREAVFGHRVAYVSWNNPETGNTHMLPIDLGPESPLIEQLQTDGFGPRLDAHPSGFGPYEQCRLARETGGTFFLLPGKETNLSRSGEYRYRMDAVRRYLPFLGSRREYQMKASSRVLSRAVLHTVHELNPHAPGSGYLLTLRRNFAADPVTFLNEVQEEIGKARDVVAAMEWHGENLERLEGERLREPSPRWQANYDILRAQLAAYALRLRQHALHLQQYLESPRAPPVAPSSKERFWHWRVQPRATLIGDADVQQEARRARLLLEAVINNHPGTPWAARAEWELHQGFGVELGPVWYRTDREPHPVITYPKL